MWILFKIYLLLGCDGRWEQVGGGGARVAYEFHFQHGLAVTCLWFD